MSNSEQSANTSTYGTVERFPPRVIQNAPPTMGRMPVRPATAESIIIVREKIVEEPGPPERLVARVAPYVCEFLGTFVFVFTVACCPPGFFLPTAIAGMLVALTYVVGFISGGHLNPAISVATFLAGKMPCLKCLCYILAQLAGGILASLLFHAVFGFGNTTFSSKVIPPQHYIGNTTFSSSSATLHSHPAATFTIGAAMLVEALYTAMLCFVALNAMCSSTNDRNEFFAIAVGFVYVAGGYAVGSISGALFNPSLALSLSFYHPWGLWYTLVEIIGALVAALLFRICRVGEYTSSFTFRSTESNALNEDDSFALGLSARMLNEFSGAFWIMTTMGLSTILATPAIAWSTAGAYISAIYAFGNVSSGYFNPVLTFAMALRGSWPHKGSDANYYVLAQSLAAVPAGLLMRFIHSQPHKSAEGSIGLFIYQTKYKLYQYMIVEFFFTVILVYVVLVVATSSKHRLSGTNAWPNFYFALAIGFVIASAVYAAGNISGGYLNPAVALSFAVSGEPVFYAQVTVKNWPHWGVDVLNVTATVLEFVCYYLRCFLYWIPELLGAIVAAFLFRYIHVEPEKTEKMPPIERYS